MSRHPKTTSLPAKAIFVFCVTFGVVTSLVIAAALFAALTVTMSGGGAFVVESYNSLGLLGSIGVVLGVSLAISLAITSIATVVLWISHPAIASASAGIGPLQDTSTAPSAWTALIPDISVVTAIASIAFASAYLARPSAVFAYWHWSHWIPWIAGLSLVVSGTVLALRWMRHYYLPRAWWRLRLVLLIGAAAILVNATATLIDEQRHCSRDVLTAIAQAENANGLSRYLARHEVCHGIDADHLLASLLTFETSSPDDTRTMMTSLLKAGAQFDSSDWTLLQRARPADLGLALDAVSDAVNEASMSKNALEEVLMHMAYENDTSSFQQFVAHGFRLDAAEWRDHGFYMLQRSLEKPDHSWKFHDALIEAGAQLEPSLRALLLSMRKGSVEPVQDWTPAEWMRLVAPDQDESYTLAAFAAVYATDEQSRMEYQRVSSTDVKQLLAVTQQPALCDLIRIADPRAALARLESIATQSLYPSCRDLLWDLRAGESEIELMR